MASRVMIECNNRLCCNEIRNFALNTFRTYDGSDERGGDGRIEVAALKGALVLGELIWECRDGGTPGHHGARRQPCGDLAADSAEQPQIAAR